MCIEVQVNVNFSSDWFFDKNTLVCASFALFVFPGQQGERMSGICRLVSSMVPHGVDALYHGTLYSWLYIFLQSSSDVLDAGCRCPITGVSSLFFRAQFYSQPFLRVAEQWRRQGHIQHPT
jgi:hypothetical protein